MTDVLAQLLEVINFVFDFRKKISANMEGMQALTAQMKTYGIDVSTPQVVLTLMENIEVAACKDFRQEFCLALQNIRAKYTYSHTHKDVLLRDILQELAKADSVGTLKDAPTPGTANAVTTMLKKMRTTGNYDSSNNNDYTESSLSASSDKDDELMATTSTCGHRRKGKNSKEKTTGKKEKDNEGKKKKKKNDCPHCKKIGHKRPHRNTAHDKCFWNKVYKGWHPRSICDELEIDFKPRGQSSAQNWEDGLNRTNDGEGGCRKGRMIRKRDGH